MFLVKKLQLWRLNSKIECKREEMIKFGMGNGLTNERTIRLSQELDELLNLHVRKSVEHEREKNRVSNMSLKLQGSLSPRWEQILISVGMVIFIGDIV